MNTSRPTTSSRFFAARRSPIDLSEIPGFDVARTIRKTELAPTRFSEIMSIAEQSLKMMGLTVSLLNSPRESFVGEAGAPNLAHVVAPITKTLRSSYPKRTLAVVRRGRPAHNPGRDQSHTMVSYRAPVGQVARKQQRSPRFVNSSKFATIRKMLGLKQLPTVASPPKTSPRPRYRRVTPKGKVDWEIKVSDGAKSPGTRTSGKRFGRCGATSWRR